MGRVFVVGSINVDLVCRAERAPRPGETVFGSEFATHPGGKGANQAVAAARLGAETWMVGRVGEDVFGQEQRDFLARQGVRTEHVRGASGVPTGVAVIVVSGDGENSIVVVPGANASVTPGDVSAEFAEGDVVVCQFEIPLPTVFAVFDRARAAGATTILNPAPAAVASRGDLSKVEVLVVNETELAFFLERPAIPPDDLPAISRGLRMLRARDGQAVIATLGGHGLVALVGDREIVLPAHESNVVDTTAAGDTFVGALAARVASGDELERSLDFATLAASICVERRGAGSSIPSLAEVEARRRDS